MSGILLSWSIVLAEILRHVLAGHPAQRPARGPCPRVGARIVNGDIVLQGIEIGTRKALHEVQLPGVRQAAVGEPEALVEALRIDDQRVALPAPDGAAEVERVVGVALDLSLLLAGVRVDETPVAVAAAHHHEHPLPIALLQELHAEAVLELAWAAWRQAMDEHGVVFEEGALAVDVQIARPGLE